MSKGNHSNHKIVMDSNYSRFNHAVNELLRRGWVKQGKFKVVSTIKDFQRKVTFQQTLKKE